MKAFINILILFQIEILYFDDNVIVKGIKYFVDPE